MTPRTALRAIDPVQALLTACALAAALALASPAHAQSDAVVQQARAAGIVGEQADGFLGVVGGRTASTDVRAHVDQVNIGRRSLYAQRANTRGVAPNEMAAAVACEIFSGRIAVGEYYRDEGNVWRQRTASQGVVMPSFCSH